MDANNNKWAVGLGRRDSFMGIKCCFLSMADDFATFEEENHF